jgi:prolyl oligopeptidase
MRRRAQRDGAAKTLDRTGGHTLRLTVMHRLARTWSWVVLTGIAAGCGAPPPAAAPPPATPATAAAPATSATPDRAPAAPRKLAYPAARREDLVDVHHGVQVPDPYRWLEDPDSDETRAWIAAQNALTGSYLASLPARDRIRARLAELWRFDAWDVPEKVADRYFFTMRKGLQNQSVLYWLPARDAEPRVLLDPNQMSEDGTVALARYELSDDGTRLAYGIQDAGSDWVEWRVRDVATGKDLDDVVRWTKFGTVAWSHTGDGFYYGRYPVPDEKTRLTGTNMSQKLYFHRLGTPQSEDTLVYERPDEPRWGFHPRLSEDGKYLLVTVTRGTGPQNLVLYRELSPGKARRSQGARARGAAAGPDMTALIDRFEGRFELVGNDGPVLWFLTNLDAPRGRLIAIDLRRPERGRWREVIAESEATLQDVSMVGDRFFASYLEDARSRVWVHDRAGKRLGEVALPGIGTASGFAGQRAHDETFYSFTSLTTPTTIYRYDVASGRTEVFRQTEVAFDASRYEVKQVFVHSKDGTRVPMFLAHARGLALGGDNPTLLYGYGGFQLSVTPTFSATRALWLEMGGVLAIANLRGGGEYGEAWHEAGTKLRKQNVFDDFIAAAEWLIAQGYTASRKLAIQGRSNGGLLIGAAMTQRPELFGVALPAVGVMDMLRFHRFTIGWAWVDDYGSADDPEQFRAIHAYSPYHNLRPARYPATLVTTGDHDDRVVPGHSFKFAAALQAAQQGAAPALIRIDTRAGHGAGKPTSMLIDEDADILAFTAANLGMTYPP